jgi:hypothetical protein
MFFMGQTEHGVYADELAGVHPNVLEQYYGVDRTGTSPTRQTGAGHPPDEADDIDDDDLEWENLEDQVAADQESNFHHEAAVVPDHANPFQHEGDEEIFQQVFDTVTEQGLIPAGYGLLPEEWEDGEYPSYELIRSGKRSGNNLHVALPDFIWRRRAEMWGQAIDIVNRLTYIHELEN